MHEVLLEVAFYSLLHSICVPRHLSTRHCIMVSDKHVKLQVHTAGSCCADGITAVMRQDAAQLRVVNKVKAAQGWPYISKPCCIDHNQWSVPRDWLLLQRMLAAWYSWVPTGKEFFENQMECM
jgi:hypothetical protein